jgi:protein-disulfide isomerase
MFKYLNSVSGSIVLGSVIIAFSILLSSGVIKIKGLASNTTPTTTVAAPTQPTTQQAAAPVATPAPPANAALGHFPPKGADTAKVALIEFGDMRCPFCKQYFTTTEPQIMSDYVVNGKIKYAFRQFEFLGPASTTAGNAIECANEQNKFWDYWTYLYKNQPDESDTTMYVSDKLTSIATDLGLNGTQFKSCLDSTKYSKNLTDDQADASAAGVNATPSFVIGKLDSTGTKIVNGKLEIGAVPYATIKADIDSFLTQ